MGFIAALPSFRRRPSRSSSLLDGVVAARGYPTKDPAEFGDAEFIRAEGGGDVHQLVHGLHVKLAERLHHLQLADGSCPPHVNWLANALAVSVATHAGLQGALKSSYNFNSNLSLILHSTASALRPSSDDQQRSDKVVGLLDVCYTLKRTMADIEAHVAQLERALHGVEETLQTDCNPNMSSSPAILRKATRRLSASLQVDIECVLSAKDSPCNKLLTEARACLLHLAKRESAQLKLRYCSSTRVGTADTDQRLEVLLNEAAQGAILITLLVLSSSLSSLMPPAAHSARKMSPILIMSKLAGGKNIGSAPIWVGPLLELQKDLAREENSGGAIFKDLHNLRTAAVNIERLLLSGSTSWNIYDMKKEVKALRKSLAEVQTSTSTIRCLTASLFHDLLAFRLHFL